MDFSLLVLFPFLLRLEMQKKAEIFRAHGPGFTGMDRLMQCVPLKNLLF